MTAADIAGLRALLDTALGLGRRTMSSRVALARASGVIHSGLLPLQAREAVLAELETAQTEIAVPLEPKAVERALRAAWGEAPGRVLDELDPDPLSVSATAQVHGAVLDGEPVAVKLARPGVAEAVRSELVLLDVLAGPLRSVFGALDVAGVLRELREAALDELDLEHEAGQQARVRRALRRLEGVDVPAVVADRSAEAVLVSARLDGPTLVTTEPEDPGAAARLLVAAHLTAWREAGLVLTDARPSHVVLVPGGGIGLLGAGGARPVARERAIPWVTAFAALADPEPDAFVAAVGELGLFGAADAAEAHALGREVLGPLVAGPARLDGDALVAVAGRAYARLEALLALATRAAPAPADLAALRSLGQLGALLSRLGVRDDWPALAREALT